MTELKDVEFMTALEKERVLKQWETFLSNGCQRQHFTKPLYKHLINHCSFIAHYDINGFYSTYFDNGEDTAHFLTQFDNRKGVPNSIEYNMDYWYRDSDMGDINSNMCLIAVKYIDLLTNVAKRKQREADISQAKALLAKYGITITKEV